MLKFSTAAFGLCAWAMGLLVSIAAIWQFGLASMFNHEVTGGGFFALWLVLSTALSIVVTAFFCVGGIIALKHYYQEKKQMAFVNEHGWEAWYAKKRSEGEEAEFREPNIFVEWLKAKHDKICPQIEFK